MSRKDKAFWESGAMNNQTYQYYYNRLTELATSIFEYKNLPDSIDDRFLELILYSEGKVIFFKDEVMGLLALQVTLGGIPDMYTIPKLRRAYAMNGYQRELDETNSVVMFNNYLHCSTLPSMAMFARRLANIDRTIDVNINAQRTPVMIQCSENEKLAMENLYKQYEGNVPVIYAQRDLNQKPIQAINTEAPFIADELYSLKSRIWNEALTYLGVMSADTSKKERLITNEVQSNLGGTVASRYSRLASRQQALEQINAMFGTNITVDYRENLLVTESGDMGDGRTKGDEVNE